MMVTSLEGEVGNVILTRQLDVSGAADKEFWGVQSKTTGQKAQAHSFLLKTQAIKTDLQRCKYQKKVVAQFFGL